MKRFLSKYISASFLYSGCRKLYYTYDLQYKKTIQNKIETRPILYSHRLLHFIGGGIFGIYLFPLNIINDLENIEIYIRKIKPYPKEDYMEGMDINFYTIMIDDHSKFR